VVEHLALGFEPSHGELLVWVQAPHFNSRSKEPSLTMSWSVDTDLFAVLYAKL